MLALLALVAAMIGFQVMLLLVTHSKAVSALPMLGFMLMIAVWRAGANYGAERYRLSRTLWRGIHGGMTGSAWAYGARTMLYLCLCALSFWQLVPWMSVRLAEQRINNASFGSGAFRFEGRAREIYGPYLLTAIGYVVLMAVVVFWFLKPLAEIGLQIHALRGQPVPAAMNTAFWVNTIATYVVFVLGMGLMNSMYLVALARHVAANTSFGGVLSFSNGITVSGWLGLIGGNLLIAVLTLGLGYPFILQRNLRFMTNNLFVQGIVEPSQLKQSVLREPSMGEGMLNLLDHGGAL
jgi:uncharacterized membrane protein YjgN (DUF898 family)